ncbi:hypothetical protein [Pseudoxanthomonas sp. USHLN014]|uniref:hypothetical protein n=1 Tax=Pseudoxanthomonas sp. USHLN014 TaxID=3081297 RepID=UPI00301BF9D4
MPTEAWVGLFGVLFGSLLTTFGVWLTNRSNTKQLKIKIDHERQIQQQRQAKERLEELYILVSHWLQAMFSNNLHLSLVMKGRTDYNQYLDAVISNGKASGLDFSRIEMIVNVYGHRLRDAYQSCISARENVNMVISDHKAAYLAGNAGHVYLAPFTSAQLELERACEELRSLIAAEARGA